MLADELKLLNVMLPLFDHSRNGTLNSEQILL